MPALRSFGASGFRRFGCAGASMPAVVHPGSLPPFLPAYLPACLSHPPSLPISIPTYLPTYLTPSLPTYLPTYLPTSPLPTSLLLRPPPSLTQGPAEDSFFARRGAGSLGSGTDFTGFLWNDKDVDNDVDNHVNNHNTNIRDGPGFSGCLCWCSCAAAAAAGGCCCGNKAVKAIRGTERSAFDPPV